MNSTGFERKRSGTNRGNLPAFFGGGGGLRKIMKKSHANFLWSVRHERQVSSFCVELCIHLWQIVCKKWYISIRDLLCLQHLPLYSWLIHSLVVLLTNSTHSSLPSSGILKPFEIDFSSVYLHVSWLSNCCKAVKKLFRCVNFYRLILRRTIWPRHIWMGAK